LIRYIRWQIVITLSGIALIGTFLGYLALSLTTVVVPAEGGTYVEGLAGSPAFINPILCQYNEVDRDICALVFNGLTKLDERGEVVPDLAEGWDVSDDGLIYTFRLRRDVRWQDGTPFTADDVIATIHAIQDPDYRGVPSLAEMWRSVGVEKLDEYTVRFTLEEPFAPFLDYTTTGILPSHLIADIPADEMIRSDFNLHPIGTGPFKVEEINEEHALLSVNPLFYGSKPYLNKIEFKFYPNYESIFAAYERGEVDGISRVLPEDLPKVGAKKDLNLFSARMSRYFLILLNNNSPFFQEKRVRKALLYALDRQGMIDRILDGQGLVAHSPIMPGTWAYYNDILKYTYDPERAEELLDEAGYKKQSQTEESVFDFGEKEGKEIAFTLLVNDDPMRVRIAEEVARQWKEIGVNVKLEKISPGRTREVLRSRRFDAFLILLEIPGDPDPYPLWHSTQIEGDGQNYACFQNREADEAIEEARRINDKKRRIELYHRFQEIFAEEVPSILLYYPIYNYAVSKKVRGVQIAPMNAPSDRFRNIEKWYIATKRVIAGESS
jgi:peptide/nickel transport system substrate-binding protein